MVEEKIIVEDYDQFWESEEATFKKFVSFIETVMEEHISEIYDREVKSNILYLYLGKGLKKRKLDKISKDFYKKSLKYFEEPTTKIIGKNKGQYAIAYEWSYPTHTYTIAIVYVYDGYEEDYYIEDDENLYFAMRGITCFLDVNLSEEE